MNRSVQWLAIEHGCHDNRVIPDAANPVLPQSVERIVEARVTKTFFPARASPGAPMALEAGTIVCYVDSIYEFFRVGGVLAFNCNRGQ